MLEFCNWLTNVSTNPLWRAGISRAPEAIEEQIELMRNFREMIIAKQPVLQGLELLSIH